MAKCDVIEILTILFAYLPSRLGSAILLGCFIIWPYPHILDVADKFAIIV